MRTILGPVIGGYLAKPVQQYPSLFAEGALWHRFSYLLLNIVVVLLFFGSCVIGLFYLEEVHPKFRDRDDIRVVLVNAASNFLTG